MQNSVWTKGLVIGIIMLFIGTSVVPSMTGNIRELKYESYTQEIEDSKPCQVSYGDPPEEEWNKTFGGQLADFGYSLMQTADGGFIIAGCKDVWENEPDSARYGDGWLIKTDKDGNNQWDHSFNSGGLCVFSSIDLTSDGGYILTGSNHYYYSQGLRDLWLVKTDGNGNEQWNKTFTSIDYASNGFCVQQTTDGGYIITGNTDKEGNLQKLWLIKTDGNGIEQWNKKFHGITMAIGESVQQTTDTGYIITGMKDGDLWLIKTDSDGNEQWNKTFRGTNSSYGYSVQQTTEGGYIVAGVFDIHSVNSIYYGNLGLIKTDHNGIIQWSNGYGETRYYSQCFVQQTFDGGYIITGSIQANTNGFSDVWLIKTNIYGYRQWDKTYGGTNTDAGWCVQQTHDGGYIITGRTTSFSTETYDLWLIKVKSENQPPIANFIYTPTNPVNTTVVQFTDTSSDPNGTIVSWWWDFGDHYYSDLQTPIHGYYSCGDYTVTLTVTDNDGGRSTFSVLVTITCADTTPPTPNPSTWAVIPTTWNQTTIYMEPTEATDPSGDVEYYFDETSGNPGGTDSGWTSNRCYSAHGLTCGTTYTYRVQTRDALGNIGSWSTSESATTDACPVEELDQQQIQVNYYNMIFSTRWSGQSFIPTKNLLTRVELYIRKVGTPPANLTLSIRNFLTGADLVSVSKSASQIQTTSSWVEFDFSDLTITPGMMYYLILRTPGGTSTNCYYWGYGTGNPYANGMYSFSFTSGNTWMHYISYDSSFKIYGM